MSRSPDTEALAASSLAKRPTLQGHTVRLLAVLFLGIELVTVVSALALVLWPMSQRAADDLSGLIELSAKTWAELPPVTRPAFETELALHHGLTLRVANPTDDARAPARHGFYLRFVERALAERTGRVDHFTMAPGPDGDDWVWARMVAGGTPIDVGFPMSRMNTRPVWALLVVLLLGTALVMVVAWWLARRLARPVAALEQAAAAVAQGESPALLPEAGPRELARLAQHFNHMALQVRELLDARTTLFAGVSHDLRTPLTRMRLAVAMLGEHANPALVARLEQDIDEMNGLLGQMLELARGLAHEPPQLLVLADWLQARAMAHHEAAAAAGATLQVVVDADVCVHAAPGLLARVVDNLITNAVRYAPGPVTLTARAEAGRVRIGVLDQGPGIPPDQVPLVWRPFQRLEASRSAATGGYGLGLAIVAQLARAQGWQVDLQPGTPHGLAAWVVLPAGHGGQGAPPSLATAAD